jgi:hypothetical protein
MAKRCVLSAASVLALSLSAFNPSYAADRPIQIAPFFAPQTSATVGLWLGSFAPGKYFDEDGGHFDFKANAFGFGGEARGIHEFSPGAALQLELMGAGHTRTDNQGCCGDKTGALHIAAGGHWISRNPEWAWGIFAGATHEKYAEEPEGGINAFAGGEVAKFARMHTWYAQVGGITNVNSYDDGAEPWHSGIFGRVGVRYFHTDYTKLEASLAAGHGDTINDSDSGEKDDLRWFQGALEFEHMAMGGPFSLFVNYTADYVRVAETDGCCDESLWMHAFKVGVRMAIGQPSLRAQDLRGANTFTFPNLFAPLVYADELD